MEYPKYFQWMTCFHWVERYLDLVVKNVKFMLVSSQSSWYFCFGIHLTCVASQIPFKLEGLSHTGPHFRLNRQNKNSLYKLYFQNKSTVLNISYRLTFRMFFCDKELLPELCCWLRVQVWTFWHVSKDLRYVACCWTLHPWATKVLSPKFDYSSCLYKFAEMGGLCLKVLLDF